MRTDTSMTEKEKRTEDFVVFFSSLLFLFCVFIPLRVVLSVLFLSSFPLLSCRLWGGRSVAAPPARPASIQQRSIIQRYMIHARLRLFTCSLFARSPPFYLSFLLSLLSPSLSRDIPWLSVYICLSVLLVLLSLSLSTLASSGSNFQKERSPTTPGIRVASSIQTCICMPMCRCRCLGCMYSSLRTTSV